MTEAEFMTHIITEICDYAVDNDMEPNDTLSTIADNIKLKHCKDNQYVFDCHECDYGGKTGTFCIRMIDDILSVLKEQEEQIKNRNESFEKAREEIEWLRGMLKEQEAVKPVEEFIKNARRYDYHCKRCGNIVGTIFDDKHPMFPGVKVSFKTVSILWWKQYQSIFSNMGRRRRKLQTKLGD